MDDPTTSDKNHDVERYADSVDRLSIFRETVGISQIADKGSQTKKQKDQNIGIYMRIVHEERKAHFEFFATSFLIDACLLLQIVLAAALTALGASKSSHVAVTVLGAVNTTIAGMLSFTKGQNLPNRLRQYQNALRKVREYIEQREREFSQPDCELDLKEEISIIVRLYQAARQNDEDNDPNAYTTPKPVSANSQNANAAETRNPLSPNMNRLNTLMRRLGSSDGDRKTSAPSATPAMTTKDV